MEKTISAMRKEVEATEKELVEVKKTIQETDDARRINECAYHKKSSLERKYVRLTNQIHHLDSYGANKELQAVIKKITDSAEEDYNTFKFFENAEGKFTDFGKQGRQLHVSIECSQICDQDVMKVLRDAEEVTGRKILDWFVSASVGYNPERDANAWLTYHITFQGETDKNDSK